MSRQERSGIRDLSYSAWHRTLADDLTYIDVDACEYCRYCRTPLALLETARDIGQPFKSGDVVRRLAELAGIEAWVVLYRIEAEKLIDFRIRRLHPEQSITWAHCTPEEWEDYLLSLRVCHPAKGRVAS